MSIKIAYLLYGSLFEWDPQKSSANKIKHGISFFEALDIWKNVHITVDGIAQSGDNEERSATIGLVSGTVYTAIWTCRENGIRLISVRKARKNEKNQYEKKVFLNS